MSSMSLRVDEYNEQYKPLETVQVRSVESMDAGSGQHARVWGLPAGTLDPRSYDVFSNFCEGSCDSQPLPRTIREIMPAGAEGLGTSQYTEIVKRMDSTEILDALSGLAGIGLKIDSNMVVKGLLPGCAAEQCGCINLGDILIAIDGHHTRKATEAAGRLMGRQGSFTTISFERHEVGSDGAQLKRSFEVELMRGGPDFISLMLRVYALENEAAELRATTISMQRNGDEPFARDQSDSWTRPSQVMVESRSPEEHLLAAQASELNLRTAELEKERAHLGALEQELLKAGQESKGLVAQLEQCRKEEEQMRAEIQRLQAHVQEGEKLHATVQGLMAEREHRQKELEGLQYKLQAVTLKLTDLEQRTLPTLQKNNQLLEQKLADAKKELQKKKSCLW